MAPLSVAASEAHVGHRRCSATRNVVLLGALSLAGCEGGRTDVSTVFIPGGSERRGASVIQEKGCGACHTIPGIDGATASVGPPLTGWSRRSYIAGNLPNEPENLMLWLRDPQTVEPGTAMPVLGVTAQEARDVAAYLYTLR